METVIYTVQNGDTLFELAKKYDTTIGAIVKFNGISDPDVLEIGQILRIPLGIITDFEQLDTYIIKKGDTLYTIAKKFDTTVDELASMNDIANVDRIYAGQVLILPKKNTDELTKDEDGTMLYTVKSGDTLYGIARKFRTTISKLINLNAITNPDMIYAGQVLKISEN